MKFGVVVDGQAEQASLKYLFSRLSTRHKLVAPKFARIPPKATPAQIVNAALPAIRIHIDSGVAGIVMLLDLEDVPECPGVRAARIGEELAKVAAAEAILQYFVVMKNAMFENWLIADPLALQSISGRFSVTDAIVGRISGKADRLNAKRILSDAAVRKSYDKVNDSIRILQKANPETMAKNSRSFRRLLRVAEHSKYIDQSRDHI